MKIILTLIVLFSLISCNSWNIEIKWSTIDSGHIEIPEIKNQPNL